MTRSRRFLRAIARAGLALALASRAAAQSEDAEVRGLFLSNCAQCHGETGDGQGTTKLDRPARSFKDGGFSYGNTPEALFRTISMGIPGTPMPAFDAALDEEKRRALAAYVITLGPEIREVSEEDMVLVVRDRPLVVRGKLPPIAEGALEHPRGLLVGTTDGFTFEYQADDVRLLGVRQGDFVRRSDWVGRGGTELEPLGKVVHLVEGGAPAPCFFLQPELDEALFKSDIPQGWIERDEDLAPVPEFDSLLARLKGTWVQGNEAGLDYVLNLPDGSRIASVRETVGRIGAAVGTGFRRRFKIDIEGTRALVLTTRHDPSLTYIVSFRNGDRTWSWTALRRPDGIVEYVGLGSTATVGSTSGPTGGFFELSWTFRPVEPSFEMELVTIFGGEWSSEIPARLGEAVRR